MKKSIFRIKYYVGISLAVFWGLIYGYVNIPANSAYELLFILAFVSVSLWLAIIKCEKCHTPMIDQAKRGREGVVSSYKDIILPPSKCPVCGLERY